jgi:hypothetical protein
MSKDVLILSSSYLPLNAVSFKRAYKMWAKSLHSDDYKIDVIHEYDDLAVTFGGDMLKAPAVLRVGHSQNINPNKKLYQPFNRVNVWTRDDGECQYCGTEIRIAEMHWDHINPKADGGHTTWENIVCCCRKCNIKKADMSLKDSKMKLRKKVIKPFQDSSLYMNIQNKIKRQSPNIPHESWKHYLFWS